MTQFQGDDSYTCSACKKTYKKDWTDEEAMQESKSLFGKRDDLVVVCDDCFNAMRERFFRH